MPVYAWSLGGEMIAVWPLIAIATAGVIAGTLFGRRLLDRIPDTHFRRIVALLLALLGGAMAAKGLTNSGG